MKYLGLICFAAVSFSVLDAHATPIAIDLGSAGAFAVLGGSTVTNTGTTILNGRLGVAPGTAITGFAAGVINPPVRAFLPTPAQAQHDLTAAYIGAAGQTCGTDLSGKDLGGLTLTPGVYCFSSSAQLTGTLTLNANGDPNAQFLFQIGSTLTTASASAIVFTGGGLGGNLFYQVGSSATLGTDTAFAGNILALTSVTLNTRARITCGRALARNGAVTLDSNTVSSAGPSCEAPNVPVPEIGTASIFGAALAFAGLLISARRRLRA